MKLARALQGILVLALAAWLIAAAVHETTEPPHHKCGTDCAWEDQ